MCLTYYLTFKILNLDSYSYLISCITLKSYFFNQIRNSQETIDIYKFVIGLNLLFAISTSRYIGKKGSNYKPTLIISIFFIYH